MIGLEPVLRTMDISLQLGVSEVIEGVDAAHQPVEFEDGLAGRPSPNSRVTKGHLKSEAALLIEIALVFTRPDGFGKRVSNDGPHPPCPWSRIHAIMHMYSAQKK